MSDVVVEAVLKSMVEPPLAVDSVPALMVRVESVRSTVGGSLGLTCG